MSGGAAGGSAPQLPAGVGGFAHHVPGGDAVRATAGHPTHEELAAALAALLVVARRQAWASGRAPGGGRTAGPADWRRHRLQATGLAGRVRPPGSA